MAILGIDNRTENWTTAEHFFPLFKDADLRKDFVVRLGEPKGTPPEDIRLELFWYGMRDYIYSEKEKGVSEEELIKDFADRYNNLFDGLSENIQNPKYRFRLRDTKDPGVHNYTLSKAEAKRELYNNLRYTEIDIVMETQNHLFIGEAKDESKFGADPSDVLVHQLIREYVTAHILVDIKGRQKKVVPFVVGTRQNIQNRSQVQFMMDKCWLKEDNVLTWDDIKKLGQAA